MATDNKRTTVARPRSLRTQKAKFENGWTEDTEYDHAVPFIYSRHVRFDADADRSISIQRKRGTNNMRDEHVAAAVAQF